MISQGHATIIYCKRRSKNKKTRDSFRTIIRIKRYYEYSSARKLCKIMLIWYHFMRVVDSLFINGFLCLATIVIHATDMTRSIAIKSRILHVKKNEEKKGNYRWRRKNLFICYKRDSSTRVYILPYNVSFHKIYQSFTLK